MKFFILLIFINLVSNAEQINDLKTLSCGHGGLGNAEIEVAFNFNKNYLHLDSIYLVESSNPEKLSKSQVYAQSFKVADGKVSLTGIVPEQSNLSVGLKIDFDVQTQSAKGSFLIDNSSYNVSDGHCRFRNF